MRRLVTVVIAAVCGAIIGFACGAENDVAPAAEKQSDLRACRSFDQLMPHFIASIDQGRTENLKKVIEAELLKPLREGDAPPINDVLNAIFTTLTRYASFPPETGALGGEYCAPSSAAPALGQANPLCEMRRAMESLIHQGKGVDSIALLQPVLSLLINYITGTGNDCLGKPRTSHYEISNIFSTMCSQDANCKLSNGLDLVIGFTTFLETDAGKKFASDLSGLTSKASIKGLLNPNSLTENDMVAIAKGLTPAIQGADAAALENAFSQLPLPDDVKTDLQPIVDDLKVVLNTPSVITPVHRALTCITLKDPNYDLVRMVYRLGIQEQCEDFGLLKLVDTARQLGDVDSRGSILFVARQLAGSVRSDDTAIDSGALVCKTLFSTAKGANQPRSNAELALPAVGELVQSGVINEAVCALDTLIFGCAGGAPPACR